MTALKLLTLDQSPLQRPDIDFGSDDMPDLIQILKGMRPFGPAVAINYRGERYWMLIEHEAVRDAFLDEAAFDSSVAYQHMTESLFGRNIQSMGGEEHRLHRGLVSRPFLPTMVRSYVEPILKPIAEELLDRIESLDEIDFIDAFTHKYPFTIITRLLGMPVENEGEMLQLCADFFETRNPELVFATRNRIDAILEKLIAERRQNPGEDLISILLHREFDGVKATDAEMLGFCRLLFPAGADTTYHTSGSMFYEVLRDSDLHDLAKTDGDIRKGIVGETLRYHPATSSIPRLALQDIVIGEANIRAGDWVILSIIAANHDPAVFPDPDRFDPNRAHGQIMTFGQGSHFCLGTHLARREMETMLEATLNRFPDMCLAEQEPVKIIRPTFRGPRSLKVRLYGTG